MNEQTNPQRKKHSLGQVVIAVGCSVVLIAAMLPNAFAKAYAVNPDEANTAESTSVEASSTTETVTANKEEVVYVKLSQTGNVEGAYVVNGFVLDEQTEIVDPGEYTSVTNLSTNDELKNENGVTTVDVAAGEFFYEGELAKDTKFPWNVTIDYKLNGKTVEPSALVGAQGALTIDLKIVPQAQGESIFADNYLVQATGSFSSDTVTGLEAEGGSVATAGSSHQVTFMVLPGGEGDYTITAQINDFSFDGFTIAAVPLSMALDTEEFETDKMGSSVDELKDAVAKIDDGAGSLKSASNAIAEGISLLAANNQTIVDGSSMVLGGISQLNDSSSLLASGSSAYIAGAEAQASDAYGKAAEAASLAAGKQGEYADAMIDAQTNLQSASVDLTAAYTALSLADPIALQAALDDLAIDLGGMQGAVSDISDAVGTDTNPGLVSYQAQASAYTASGDTSTALVSAYADLNAGIQQLASSMPTMLSQYMLFDEGIQSYVGGVSTLNSNYVAYNQGLDTFKQGTEEFRNQTVDLDQKILDGIKDELKGYLDPEYELHSFVDPSNTHVNRVQFIYMSDPIEEPEEEPVEIEEPEEETFWTRLISVFS